MEILRTPSERIAGISDFPFAENYYSLSDDIRMHYVDEGPKEAPSRLLLHGEPSWLEAWNQWRKPFHPLFSDQNPITKGAGLFFQKFVPGAADMPHAIIKEAGHFLQKHQGVKIAEKITYSAKHIN